MLKKRVLALTTAFTMVIACFSFSSIVNAQESKEAKAELNDSYMVTLTNDTINNIDYSYLTYPGFDVFMYNNGYNGMFGDEHLSGITLTLHGSRVAGNGDIHLLPVPEQWDAAVPATSMPIDSRVPRNYDRVNNIITLPMKYVYDANSSPQLQMNYDLVATPEPGGVALSVVLRSDLPRQLEGSASFNLELIPSLYKNKSYQTDSDGDGKYDVFGVFPLAPEDPMNDEWPRPELVGNAWYVDQWNEEKGPWQPQPFVQGYEYSFAPEDSLHHLSITSDKLISIYDGRNRSQNGWFTMCTKIPAGSKAGETVVTWHIKAPVKANWVREPSIAHSQAGYGTGLTKIAVMEIDKNDTSDPGTAKLLRVNADGSHTSVFEAPVGEPRRWTRFDYRDFDFSSIKTPGLYVIEYKGIKTDVFPIADDVYDNTWQAGLSGFLATAMDHMEVREGYRIWHGAAHMDDARMGEPFANSVTSTAPSGAEYITWFDGQGVAITLPDVVKEKGYKPGDRIPGLNVGGWFDAGDFDIEIGSNMSVLRNLIYTAEAFDNLDGYDTLSVEWNPDTGGTAEMHRPDGIPDIVQQIKHGAMQIRAEIENVGVVNGAIEVPTLRQYTHLGDGATDTDGYIYDPSLGENDVVERDGKVYSGKNDDRMYMMWRSTGANGVVPTAKLGSASIGMAGAAATLKEYYPEFAQQCLETAEKIWAEEGPAAMQSTSQRGNAFNTLIQLMLATEGTEKYDYYKNLYSSLLSLVGGDNPLISAFPINNYYAAAFIKDKMGADYKKQVEDAAVAVAGAFNFVPGTPFGFGESLTATWGPGSGKISSGFNATMLLKTVGDIPGLEPLKENVIRAINYTLGTHPYNDTSWMTGVGANSHKHPYNSNRAEEGFIPGSIVPGYINFRPDFPESLDNFSFLWAENECTIGVVSSWIAPAKMAAEIAAEGTAGAQPVSVKDFSNDFIMQAEKVENPPNPFTGQPGLPSASLKAPGFDLFMYNTTFDMTFGDQHCAGVELIQQGRRIATNGDIRLLPTPEQWDATPPPTLNNREADLAANTVSANLTMPATKDGQKPAVDYTIKAVPEPGGVKLTVTLKDPLPADLVGKAGFNLEFIPSLFREKSYQADSDGDGTYDSFGVFPLLPFDDMELKDRARTDDQAWYVKEWNKDRGDYQPVLFAKGSSMVFAAEDDDNRIRIVSDSGDLELYDGRSRAQNGWFVLRTLIPEGSKEIVWHISPDIDGTWTREPNVAHSQAGYAPSQSKVAVIELDPRFNAPSTASVERLNADGSYSVVYTGDLGAAMRWLRYDYREFDFSSVDEPGMYVINYDGKRTDVFPIAAGVYDKSWQQSLSGFLAKQMDHIKVRETYKIVHAASHMDDAVMWPLVGEEFRDESSFDGTWFDGQNFYETSRTNTQYKSGEHIPGLNKGGWFDAGDFDQEATRIQGVIEDLAFAFKEFGPQYDTLAVEWSDKTGGSVELHRPDGVPDIVQQVKHGAMQVLARIEAVGYNFKVLEVPTLRQYTHLGDASKDTDGFVYDPSLGVNERSGLRSGRNDDRLAMIGKKSPSLQYGAAAALAAAYYVVKDYDSDFAERCLNAAKKIWDEEELITSTEGIPPTDFMALFAAQQQIAAEWNAALELLIATDGDAQYKEAIEKLFPLMEMPSGWFMSFQSGGWKASVVLPYMDQEFKTNFKEAAQNYVTFLDASLASNPFGVPSTNGMWGGSTDVVDMGMRMYFLNRAFPDIVSTDYTLRAANYILGTHPYNNTSWLSGVGTRSVEHAYGNTRADDTYIAGGIVPGYVNIAPDFPEALDDFGMLWFESEYVIDTAAKWVTVGNAASKIVAEQDNIVVQVKSDVSTIVAGRAANLPISVVLKAGVEDADVTVKLLDPAGKIVGSVNGLSGLVRIEKAIEGVYKFVVYVDGKETSSSCTVDCVAEPVGLWSPKAAAGEQTKITFGAPISFNEAKKAVKIGTETVANDLLTVSGNELTIAKSSAVGQTIVVTGLKYLELFPSYSFAFTMTAE